MKWKLGFITPAILLWQSISAQIEPFYIKSSPIWRSASISDAATPFPFKVPESDVRRTIDMIVVEMNRPDFIESALSNRSCAVVAGKIKGRVDSVLGSLGIAGASEFARQWFLAEAICEFVRATVKYDHANTDERESSQTRIARSTFDYIFSKEKPTAVCWGIAVSVRDLARSAGLRCTFVNGIARGLGAVSPSQSDRNHGIVVFTFSGGFNIPADVSSHICDYQNNQKPAPSKKSNSWMVLPRTPAAWEFFLATFSPDIGEEIEISGDKQNQIKLTDLTFRQWAGRDTSYLAGLLKWLERNSQ